MILKKQSTNIQIINGSLMAANKPRNTEKKEKAEITDTKPFKVVEDELLKVSPEIFAQLKPDQKDKVIRAVAVTISKFHSGPLPSPDTLREYNEILPGCAQTIFDVFVTQSNHRIDIEKKVIISQQNQSKTGQWLGFIIAILVMGGAVACILTGHDAAGGAIGGIDIVGLAAVFVLGQNYQRKNLVNKRPEAQQKR